MSPHSSTALSLVKKSLTPEPRGEEDAGHWGKLLAPAVMRALEEGLAHTVGGEVVIRSGDAIGRIYLYKGAIAWVNCSRLQVRVRDTLLENSGISADELDAVLQESQQLRQHFAETLLAWGLIDRGRLWECLRIHNARHLGAISLLREQPQALFVPLVRTYSAGLIFKLEELLEWCETKGSVETEPDEARPVTQPVLGLAPGCALGQAGADHAKVSARLEALLPEGALAAVLFDTEARHVCGHVFRLPELESGSQELARWLLGLVEGSALKSQGREVLMVAEDTVHVVSRSEPAASVYLWVLFDSATSVGRVLSHSRRVLKELGQEFLGAASSASGQAADGRPRGS